MLYLDISPFMKCGSEKNRFVVVRCRHTTVASAHSSTSTRLLGARVLGDGLRSLADGVLGKLARQEKTNGRLDFAARDGRAAVVVGEARGLCSNALKDVVDEAVHDRHGLAADAGVRVDLLEDLVDVDGVALPSPPLALLVTGTDGLSLAGGLLRSLTRWLWRHDSGSQIEKMCLRQMDFFQFIECALSRTG